MWGEKMRGERQGPSAEGEAKAAMMTCGLTRDPRMRSALVSYVLFWIVESSGNLIDLYRRSWTGGLWPVLTLPEMLVCHGEVGHL